MIALSEIIAADEFSAGFVIVNAGEQLQTFIGERFQGIWFQTSH